MRLQDLGFLGFGYAPWGVGSPGATNPAAGTAAGGAGAGGAGSDGASSGINGLGAGGSALGSALSDSLTGSATELAVVRESETLKIQLTDGSQITIRVRAQGAEFGAAQTQADGSSASTAAIFASSKLHISVDGTLSSADMQAISDVVSQVNSLATQFFSGDVQDAFAAAASLNIDPSEIAGFSMKLSYSSLLVQQASADTTSSTTGVTGASDVSAPAATSGGPATGTSAPDVSSNTSASGASTSAPATGPPDASSASQAASPQHIIVDFIQTVMAKLARGSADSHSHLRASSRWKLHLLAQALPAYAQAQAAGPTTPATTASGTPVTAAQSAPPAASNRYPTLQAARLAADTLSQLAQ